MYRHKGFVAGLQVYRDLHQLGEAGKEINKYVIDIRFHQRVVDKISLRRQLGRFHINCLFCSAFAIKIHFNSQIDQISPQKRFTWIFRILFL